MALASARDKIQALMGSIEPTVPERFIAERPHL
jgi:hypothetical protein